MRIFNRLRKLQLQAGKIKNYALYALGEIVLIVLGILIALQLNNWNQELQSARQQSELLETLQQTLYANDREITTALTELDDALRVTDLRIQHTGPHITEVDPATIATVRRIDLVALNLAQGNSNPALLQAGDFSQLSSPLQNLLLDYAAAHESYQHAERNVKSLTLKLRENHQRYVSLLTEADYGDSFPIEEHNVYPSDYAGWLSDRDTQNLSVEIKWKLELSIRRLEQLREINGAILETIAGKLGRRTV